MLHGAAEHVLGAEAPRLHIQPRLASRVGLPGCEQEDFALAFPPCLISSCLLLRRSYGLDLFLLSVDEGIAGYRDDSLATVRRNEQTYGIPLVVRRGWGVGGGPLPGVPP